ncbi:MAG TPA: DUF418 domain-containing protein [Acidobacteriota bacterium]|nr:DUF418 domain-containing protein [Acidobacteriota bacterium]
MNERETIVEGREVSSPEGAQPFRPVTEKHRLTSVDVLRGVALLGILTMNIVAFSYPFTLYMNPVALGPISAADWWSWAISHLLFEQKFMAIFSMLFGAGLVLMWDRAEAQGRSIFGVWMRRNLWLMLIGLLHGFLLWFGDILFVYGSCGLLIYFFRRFRPRTLAVLGLLVVTGFVGIFTLQAIYFDLLRSQHQQAVEKLEAGEELSETQKQLKQTWIQTQKAISPDPAKLQEEIEIYRNGTYLEQLIHRAPTALQTLVIGLFTFGLWRAGGLMLLGMALMKWGVFSAALSRAAYLRLTIGGYLLGLPFVVWSINVLTENDYDLFKLFGGDIYINYFASLPVALGHVGLVMLFCKSSLGQGLKDRLAAVGRMAFTNYLMHTVLCTTLFYGSYGLGLFASFSRTELWLVVLGVWILQLIYSPLWLKHFRFGPAEWLWRSLTYFKLQPMRKQSA